MKIIETKVYEFYELNDAAKEKARDWFRESMDHTSELEDYFSQSLGYLGYPTDDIEFSLSSCQGDGVAFYGLFDLAALSKRDVKGNAPPYVHMTGDPDQVKTLAKWLDEHDGECSLQISRTGLSIHYSHYNTMVVVFADLDVGEDEEFNKKALDLKTLLKMEVTQVSQTFEKEGYGIIESNDDCDETIRINEYTFTNTGERFG